MKILKNKHKDVFFPTADQISADAEVLQESDELSGDDVKYKLWRQPGVYGAEAYCQPWI